MLTFPSSVLSPYANSAVPSNHYSPSCLLMNRPTEAECGSSFVVYTFTPATYMCEYYW